MQDMTEPVPRAVPEPVQQLSFLLWKFLAMAVERLCALIDVVFVPESVTITASHISRVRKVLSQGLSPLVIYVYR
jgi:hypothetical protein